MVHPGLAKPQMAQPLSSAVANNSALQKQLERIAGQPLDSNDTSGGHAPSVSAAQAIDNKMAKFQKSLLEGDLDFVSPALLNPS